jgi:hypothetical protein
MWHELRGYEYRRPQPERHVLERRVEPHENGHHLVMMALVLPKRISTVDIEVELLVEGRSDLLFKFM